MGKITIEDYNMEILKQYNELQTRLNKIKSNIIKKEKETKKTMQELIKNNTITNIFLSKQFEELKELRRNRTKILEQINILCVIIGNLKISDNYIMDKDSGLFIIE